MGTRTLHNFKRRLKLIEKHTGKPYWRQVSDGKGGKGGKGKGKGGSKSRQNSGENKGGKGSKTGKGGKLSKAGKNDGKSAQQQANESGGPRKSGKVNDLIESCHRMLDGDALTAEVLAAPSSLGKAATSKPKATKLKRLVRKKPAAAKSTANENRKDKVVVEEDSKALVPRKLKKRKKLTVETPKPIAEKKISKKALRRARIRERMSMRHNAYIVCPGSVTERSARGPLNGNEVRLLATGALSWRWLRDEDADCMPPSPYPVADAKSHSWELEGRVWKMSHSAGAKLKHLDACLETDAFWPPCVARLDLAARLQTKRGLQRRCERHLADVVAPLLEEPEAPPASGEQQGGAAGGSAAPLLAEARRILVRCAQEWQQAVPSGSIDGFRLAWLRMFRYSLAIPEEDAALDATGVRAWWRAVRCVILARMCPRPDAETQQQLLRNAAGAAATAAAGRTSTGERPKSIEAASIVMIPLGLFTFWQALLLVAAARSLGHAATVVRRSAAGPPQVLFRSADVPADDPAAWSTST